VTQLEPVYSELLSRFNKLLKQRSHFWRSDISKQKDYYSLLDSFDSQMALLGTRIYRRRKRALNKLSPFIQYWQNKLSKSRENIKFNYISSIQTMDNNEDDEAAIMAELNTKLLNQRDLEVVTGKCSVGPHRDDIEFLINDISVRKYGSSGQQRTITLALKMAELDLLRKILVMDPILVLDDVLAELDIVRQNLLLEAVGNESQCFISATHLDKFSDEFLKTSQIVYL